MDAGELQRDPLRDHPLLAAGVDEQQVLLPVLEEAEIAAGVALLRRHLQAARRRHPARRRGRDIGLDAVERIDGDALALAQAMHQLAVIDRAAAERRFRHIGLAAEFGDLAQDLVVFHAAMGIWAGRWAAAERAVVLPSSAHWGECLRSLSLRRLIACRHRLPSCFRIGAKLRRGRVATDKPAASSRGVRASRYRVPVPTTATASPGSSSPSPEPP